jgi:methionyl-tRNA formyltransferase
MKLIFAGTPEFAAQALAALIAAGHQLALVLTQPDRPSGRGMALRPSPVKTLALEHGIEVFQPPTLRDAAAQARLQAVGADAMIVAAYGLILPQAVLDLPRFGCINIHASLLPRWRGAAPIQRAILAGDAESGVCIMQMEAGLDTGPVLLSAALPIAADETAGSLHDRLAELGAGLIVAALEKLPLAPTPQADCGVTYAAKIEKSEAMLDWNQSAQQLARQVRAFNPFPGALATLGQLSVKVWRASAEAGEGSPGTILASDRAGILVACGEGALRLTELQKAGGKRLSAAQFLAGASSSLRER